MTKAAALIVEKCDIETDDIVENETVTLIKKIENREPFVTSSILFVCVSVIATEFMI